MWSTVRDSIVSPDNNYFNIWGISRKKKKNQLHFYEILDENHLGIILYDNRTSNYKRTNPPVP